MNKRFSMLLGAVLIGIGGLMLLANLALPILGISGWRWGVWRLWPMIVIGVGLLFVLTPLLVRSKRGLGGLFIPGVPTLVTGGILLFASVFEAWWAWEWLWPLEVLAVAAGFLFASIYMRNTWLLVPAIIIGANGLLMQFCALTGWWEVWAVLWTIEPLSVGLALLVAYTRKRRAGLLIAGTILCAIAALGLMGMLAVVAIRPGWWVLNMVGPLMLVGIGVLLLFSNVLSRPGLREAVSER